MIYLGNKPVGVVTKGDLNILKYAGVLNSLFQDCVCPEKVILDFQGNTTLTSLAALAFRTSGLKHLVIKNLSSTKTNIPMNAFCCISNDLETVTFENCSIAPNSFESFCRSTPKLTTVNGELDCSNCAGGNTLRFWFVGSISIENFRIKPNTMSAYAEPFGTSNVISDESYISVANGLNPNVTGVTLKATANQQSVISSIMGTNNNGTFVADEQGTLSLADFITNVKGWTLA